MIEIRHHLSDDLLSSYAAGTLAEGWSIAVASHLALCPACRARLKGFEQLGGQMIDRLPADDSIDSAWNSVKSRIASEGGEPAVPVKRKAVAGDAVVLPEPLRSYVGGDLADVKWKSLGRGAYHLPIKTGDNETSVRLLRIPAGKPVPEHGHGGRELTLVLSGSFTDETDTYGRGDIEDADSELVHQPIASPQADCICLAVTDAPLKFRSWIVRLVQPLLGI
jgi:putative transcriptional regulator